MTLDQLFDHGRDFAKVCFEQSGELQPMWICESENGELIPVCVQMPAIDERDDFAETLRVFFKQRKIVRYVAMLECWMLIGKVSDGIPESVQRGASIQSHPDRMEAIQIIAEDVNGKAKHGIFHILRPENGDASLSPFKETPFDHAEGRFCHLLTPDDSHEGNSNRPGS